MKDNHSKHIEQPEIEKEPMATSEPVVENQQQKKDEISPKKVRWVQIRMIPIWLRMILITLLLALVIFIGLRVGYGYLGDGNPSDVLKKETWLHIVDIIKGKE